ncbi:tetratricopeptide repeat protein [Dongia mobilis]|jgi:tetratricopeptide (TPR) repeat protein|uniref:tetratricopeptide repeat protein n=1 Tax=Dongia sp. TaxID=1977262 RepID=UPI0026EB12E5
MTLALSALRFKPALFALALLPAMIACAGKEDGDGTARADSSTAQVIADQAAEPDWSLSGALLAGRLAYSEGDDAMAAKLLGLAREAAPGDQMLAARTLSALLASGDFKGAVALAAEIKTQGAKTPYIGFVEMVDRVKAGDFKAAKAALDSVSDDGIGRIAKPFFAAWIVLGLEGKLEPAIAALTPLNDFNGLGAAVTQHTALMEDQLGRSQQGLEHMRGAADAGAASARFIELYVEFLHRGGKVDDARAYIDQFRTANAGIAGAIADPLSERLAQPPAEGPILKTPAMGLAEAFFDLGTILQSENIEDQAKVFARLALELDPDLDISRLLIGNLMQQRERWAEAIDMYRTIRDSSIYRWSAEISVAECQQSLEDLDGAIATLQGLVKARPNRTEAVVELGDLFRREKRFAEAVDAYDQVIGAIKQPAASDWTLYYSRGVAHERNKQWDKAEPDFKKALELSPDQPYVLNYLAYTWVERRENLDEALKMLNNAVEQRPEEGFIVDSLGWAYFQLGEFQKAVTYLERAVELQPTDPVLNDHLGDAYWRVGRKNEARFQWHRSLSFKPEEDQISVIEEKLKSGLGDAKAETTTPSGG